MATGKRKRGRWLRRAAGAAAVVIVLPLAGSVAGVFGRDLDWRTAPRYSIGIAPDPRLVREPVVQVYVARAFGWRGAFGVHSWFAVKPSGANAFDVYEVVGWSVLHGYPAVSRSQRPPDGMWFGNRLAWVSWQARQVRPFLTLLTWTSITLAGSCRMPPSHRRRPKRSSLGLISTFSTTSWVRPLENLPPMLRRARRWMT